MIKPKTKIDDDKVKSIVSMKKQKIPSRTIASILKIGKTTVNDIFNRYQNRIQSTGKAKLLVLDVETAASQVLTFGRFKQNIGQANIIKEGGWIICASWRWLDSDKTEYVAVDSKEALAMDDSKIACRLFELYEQADAIIAHNGKNFDHKVIQTRMLANGLPALPSVKVIDTLVMAKRTLKLPSNRLDSIGDYFKIGRKIETGGIELWKKAQFGDKEAIKNMIEYCQQDVNLLHDVYLKLRQIGNVGSGINMGLYSNDDEIRCPTCNSTDILPTGRTVKTSLNEFSEYRCNSCGSVHRDRVSITDNDKRKSLLSNIV